MLFWQNYALALIGISVLVVLFKMRGRFKPPTRADVLVAEEVARTEYDSLPKCICGEVAKYPAPVLERNRGAWDWLRSYFAAPPRYKRSVNLMLPPVFCSAHVHVADALMDQFIFRVRSEYSNLNAKIAGDAAGFEQEALLKCVGDSLTEIQRRATRRSPATIRVLPMKTGTDDVVEGQ